MNKFRFSYLARRIAALSGRPATFLLALSAVILWGLSGPLFDYSTTWQLIIIQNTQNRDTEAMQIKLDELIRATQGAHIALLDLEELEEEQLDRYRRSDEKLAREARERLRSGRLDTDSPDIKPLKSG